MRRSFFANADGSMRLPRNNGPEVPEVAHLRRTGQSHRGLGSGLTLDTAYYGSPDPQRLPILTLKDQVCRLKAGACTAGRAAALMLPPMTVTFGHSHRSRIAPPPAGNGGFRLRL